MILDALPLFLTNLTLIAAISVILWIISILIDDVSFIDAFWGIGFVIIAWTTFQVTDGVPTSHRVALILLATLWGVRLGVYLLIRWRMNGPDPRYAAFIARSRLPKHAFTLLAVFLLQALLMTLIAAPLYMGQIPVTPDPMGPLAMVGFLLFALGFYFEAVADIQLANFRQDPDNAGKVLDSGLWRLTRHPNYFGDVCLWWGIYLVAAESPVGQWSFFGPLLLTILLLKWSGVPLLEKHLKKSRPDYLSYMRRTNAFIPGRPKLDE